MNAATPSLELQGVERTALAPLGPERKLLGWISGESWDELPVSLYIGPSASSLCIKSESCEAGGFFLEYRPAYPAFVR